jgi:hypothetical protein
MTCLNSGGNKEGFFNSLDFNNRLIDAHYPKKDRHLILKPTMEAHYYKKNRPHTISILFKPRLGTAEQRKSRRTFIGYLR